MKNIIILGSKGKIGCKLKNYLERDNKIFIDELININKLLTLDYINNNKINCIINCIGSTNKKELFFNSNFLIPNFISERLNAYDLELKQKIILIHISTIGVTSPYVKGNFKNISIKPFRKEKIKYNLYELSKSCGEYSLRNNLKNSENINTIILQPSNIIFKNSDFLKKLRIFLFFLPFKSERAFKLPLTPIDYLLKSIKKLINSPKENKFEIKKLYKREEISTFFRIYVYLSFFKIKIPLYILKKCINYIPEISFLYSLKRILIFIFIL